MECGDRGERVAFSADHADSNINGSRADSDRGDDILGPHGDCRHGRAAGCDGPYVDFPAGLVRRLVPDQTIRSRGTDSNTQTHCHGRGVSVVVSRPAIIRAAGFFALWTILTGSNPADLVAGVVAAWVANWASLHLMPPGAGRVRPARLAGLGLRFLH